MSYCKSVHLFFTAILYMLSVTVYAQAPPQENPDGWVLKTEKSDEFNGTSLDTTKWWTLSICDFSDSIRHGYNWGGGAFFRHENVSVSNGNVIFKVDYNPDSSNESIPCVHYVQYPFYSGGIQSIQTNDTSNGIIGSYTFGYYEMRAKLPGYYDSSNQPVGLGFMPTFWIYYQVNINHCIRKHDEVDILEPSPDQYFDARSNHFSWHDEYDSCSAHAIGQYLFTNSTPLFEDYHIYGLELFPDRITYYFDNVPYFTADTNDYHEYVHSLNMHPFLAVVMNLQIGSNPRPPVDAPFPEYMYVDYFHYYQLKTTENVLQQNYPNPAVNTTEIDYKIIDNASQAFINVYDMAGREIKSIPLHETGASKITFDCTNLHSGIYFYDLWVNNQFVASKKLVVMNK